MTDPTPAFGESAALFRAALNDHAADRLAEAEASYRLILAQSPDHAEVLGMLGLILADLPDEAEAESVLLRHLALRPDAGVSLQSLGRLRTRQGDDEAAVAAFQRAAQSLPDLAPVHNELGVSLHRMGRREEALAALDRAIELDPDYDAAQANRGMVLFDCARFDEAVDVLAAVLARNAPDLAELQAPLLGALARAARKIGRLAVAESAARARLAAGHDDAAVEQLALILDYSKRPKEARTLRNDLARRAGIQSSGRSPETAETVLVLGGVGAGHVPTRYLLDPQTFAIRSISLLSVDEADAPLGAVDREDLQAASVIFSTLANVDRDGGQLDAAAALCADLGKPVLNPPSSIRKTGRDGATALFADIPGMVTPLVRRMRPADLSAFPFDGPLLVRPAGDHGGESLVLLRSEADRSAYLASGPEGQLLVTPFHDFRSADGYWRKYRLIFVDRKVYPFHLAIGEDWLLHYWRAEMALTGWKLDEEERFLTDWRSVFGPRAAAAVEETARRLDLDYGGLDCTLTADGQVLLFEANANFLLHLDEPVGTFAYKHRCVPAIREAFTRLVRERAGGLEGLQP
jgi:tetratricopeptide (TPR) repeat protein